MPLDNVITKINRYKQILTFVNIKKIVLEIFKSGTVADEIIEIIQDRLYDSGIDGFENELKTDNAFGSDNYSFYTQEIKEKKGQKTSNVTLNDSGEFYESFEDEITGAGLNLTADFLKDNGHIVNNFNGMYASATEMENAVLKMTPQEKEKYIKTNLLPEILIYLRFELKKI